ncbi:MAG: hypothetical protein JWP63_5440 [Candidatus Solibacter sp.]|nr:hypothetical protein [Candidatus Solibacter sp.]
MKRMIVAAMLLGAPLWAQAPNEPKTTKLVRLQFAEPRAIQNIVSLYGVQITSNEQMKVMALYGRPSEIAAAEAAIKQLDVAPKTLELTVYFVVGGDNPQQMAGAPAAPPDIRDVIAQLKNAFSFKEYRMLDVLTLRTRVGSNAETSGIVSAGSPPKLTQFSIRNSMIGEDGTIRLDHMHAGLRIPLPKEDGKNQYLNTGIDQSVDVKEGQKVVVGRSSLEGPERALFLILMARVVQ